MPPFLFCAPGNAHALGDASPLQVRQGELIGECICLISVQKRTCGQAYIGVFSSREKRDLGCCRSKLVPLE